MAAWFVMLILLVAVMLTAAAKIQEPAWVAGFLVVSSLILSVLVMFAVFIMLTKFRPHLQGPKEYSEWLKDERRYRGQAVQKLSIREITPEPQYSTDTLSVPDDPSLFREIVTHTINVSNLEGADNVIGVLRKLGFNTEIYGSIIPTEIELGYNKKEDRTAIWIGSRVPPRVAILAIKSIIDIWSHLKYIHISGDSDSSPPDYIHDQIYLGGATATAKKYKLKSWTPEQIKAIPYDLNIEDFHKLIRSKYLVGVK